jgi:hypothetical protein
VDKDQPIELSVSDLMEIRALLFQLRDLGTAHEGDLDELRKELGVVRELDRRLAGEVSLLGERVSVLRAASDENRAAQRNLWWGVVLAFITALIGKYISLVK